MERRSTGRFPLAEEIRFRSLDRRGDPQDGVGTTVDIGRWGVKFVTQKPPMPGRLIEMSVNWPVALGGTCPLQFVAVGHVIRSAGDRAVVRIEKYEFRTRRRSAPLLA